MTWVMPTEFPNLKKVKLLAFDGETFDPNLTTKGPGFLRGESRPIGVSIAWQEDTIKSAYYPIGHQTGNTEMDVTGFLKEAFADPDMHLVAANLRYDLEWIHWLGITDIQAHCYCIQVQEAIIDENQGSYSLNNIALRRKLPGKDSGDMEERLVSLGYVSKGKPDYSKLYMLHPKYVGPYAEMDAVLTLKIFLAQQVDIKEQELEKVIELESVLQPILHTMRVTGVRADIDKADELNSNIGIQLDNELHAICSETSDVDPFSSNSLGQWCRSLGVEPPQTAKENDSVSNEWLASMGETNPVFKRMADYRRGEKIRRDFIDGIFLKNSIKGRIHPQWLSTRGSGFLSGGDVNGTRSGRLACVDPNLQQIPSRDPVYGPLVRSLFLPEPGELWLKADQQAQEIRVGLHFAVKLQLPGAAAVKRMYTDNPYTDYHTIVMNGLNEFLPPDKQIDRGTAKTINLSLAYGMGKAKLAQRLGISVKDTELILEAYHNAVPYVKQALQEAARVADKRGYVKTVLGRRRRFNEWENAQWGAKWQKPVQSKALALATWDKVRRANTYKAYNSIVQGTSAEQTKLAILACAREGKVPLLTVHDEICLSLQSKEEVAKYKELMQSALVLEIPAIVECGIGPNWAEAKEKV